MTVTTDETLPHDGLIADLRLQLQIAQDRRADFAKRRKPFTLKAAKGDDEAKQRLAELSSEELRSKHEIDDLTEALAEAGRLNDEALADRNAAADQASLDRARELANQLIAESEKFDELLAELCKTVARREALIQDIAGTRALYGMYLNSLGGNEGVNSAFRFAQAHRLYSASVHASSSGDVPLAKWTRNAVQHLELPSVLAKRRPWI
jgi:hypothetical protein